MTKIEKDKLLNRLEEYIQGAQFDVVPRWAPDGNPELHVVTLESIQDFIQQERAK